MTGRAAARAVLIGLLLAAPIAVAPADIAVADGAAGIAAYERGDYITALNEFAPLAEQGNAGAQTMLGIMYLRGQGVAPDLALAARWLRASAAQGNAQAQYRLAMMHLAGDGVVQDLVAAAALLRAAAEQGLAQAQVNLAAMLYQGIGVTRDLRLSYLYAALAARQGDAEGAGLVDLLAGAMTPADLAAAQAMVAQWKRAAP